ncbi:MAG: hypothetical protein K2W95_02875 [Candidatus Obscuribacterales bacterium]|nr:hypothetical protein [Candidatus Obscuribacterales bacterium]
MNSKQRTKQGGTLALVVALILVLVIVGVGFVIWQFLIGGNNQIRNLTDSGVLNVAKQALTSPFVTVDSSRVIDGVNVVKEFGDVLEPQGGSFRVTLQNYNRLVGKAVFAQLNAQSTGGNSTGPTAPGNANPTGQMARDNARRLTNAVNVLGQELARTLDNFDNLKGNFEDVALKNSANKLQNRTSVLQVNAVNEHAVAYAARPSGNVRNASNVFLDTSQLPPGIPPSFITSNTVRKRVNGVERQFFIGYAPLQTATAGSAANFPTSYCVPLRPGEQPHSLALEDFIAAQSPPALAGITDVIANAFRGAARSQNAIVGANAQQRSCAVVGLPMVFPAGSPGGTIIVDNQGITPRESLSGDRTAPGFIDSFMEPNGFEIFDVNMVAPCRFLDGSATRRYFAPAKKTDPPASLPSAQIRSGNQFNFAPLDPGGAPITTPAPLSSVKRLGGSMSGEDVFIMRQTVRYKSVDADRNKIMATTGLPGGPGTQYPGVLKNIITIPLVCSTADSEDGGPCEQASDALSAAADGQVLGANGQLQTNLMLLEQYILAVRGAFNTSANCVFVENLSGLGAYAPRPTPPGSEPISCMSNGIFIGSGLKDIPDGGSLAPPPFPNSNPTLEQLMADTGMVGPVGASVREDLRARASQIGGSAANLSDILNTTIPFNSIRYITARDGGGIQVTATPPASLTYRGGASNQEYKDQPPGARPLLDNQSHVPDGAVVRSQLDIPLSRRFIPFAFWECGNGQASGVSSSKAKWIPSTGRGGLLGVFRFVNCPEATGPKWCCP